ncbi:C4-dicarboxylate transporter DctA, partial [Pseudoxanthomonas sp. SGD-10]
MQIIEEPVKTVQRKPRFYQILYVQVIIAIVIGISLGYFFPETGEMMKPFGDGFIYLVKMIIAPVIFLTVSMGIAGMNDLKSVGRVAGKSFAYFITFSTLALIVGLIVSNLVQPGKGLNIDPLTLDETQVTQFIAKAEDSSLINFVMNVIP